MNKRISICELALAARFPTLTNMKSITLLTLGLFLLGILPGHSQTIYIGPASGNWGDAANWSTGSVPGSGDNVVVDAISQNSTVSTGTSQTRDVLSLGISSGDTVSISNNGLLNVNGPILGVDGTLRIDATSAGTGLNIINNDAVFSGDGEIVLTGGNSRILGPGTLTNEATIEGLGNLGFNQLAIVNGENGLIDANSNANILWLDPRDASGLVNRGFLRASGSGVLRLTGGGSFNNSVGIIEAIGAGSEVQLFSGASVSGGVLRSVDGGVIRGNTSDVYYFTDVTFAEGTQVVANNNSDFGVSGTITNGGTITVAATSAGTDIELQGDTLLTGSGTVVLGIDNGNARINGTGTLTNDANHTLRGRGNVGLNSLGIVNKGMITAEATGGPLIIDPSAGGNLINESTMQASAGGTLLLTGAGGGTFDNSAGIIQAVGAGAEVQFSTNAEVFGGTFRTEAGGVIRGNTSDNYFFTDVTFADGTQVVANNNSDFGVSGTITNGGTITVAATSAGTDIELQGDTLLTGSGTVVLGIDNGNARINGTGTLTNDANHTLRGRGNVGLNSLGIVNKGMITAEATGGPLIIDPSAGGNLINESTMQASAGGTLLLTGAGGGTFDNSAGIIQAVGQGAEVQFSTNAEVFGGTFRTEAGGVIRGNTSDNYFFTDVTFAEGTQVVANNNSDFGVSGTITNGGTITVAATSAGTDIELQGDTLLTGSGTVVLGIDNGNARINGTGTLTNDANHTLRGRGNVGLNSLGIVNKGMITAEATGGPLIIDPSLNGNLVNESTMQASVGGTLLLTGAGGGTFDNSAGLIQAVGAGAEVQLFTNAEVFGGTFRTEAGGVIRGNTSDNYFFTDVTFAEGTQVVANNNSDFGVSGTITNGGTITVAATSAGTDIELQGDTAFVGGGEIVLGINTDNARINGTGTLTNGSGHTIRGRGNLGVNSLAVFNAKGATIVADQNEAPLFLDPRNEVGSFDNRGMLAASQGGRLQLTGSGGGSFDNVGGIIRAGDGSEVQLFSNVLIDGGVIESQGSGLVRVLASQTATISNSTISANSVINNNATLTLSGEISHSGNMSINATSAGTALAIDSILDLDGGGSIRMSGGNSRILGNGVLINRDHTISGLGNIGFNQAAVTNSTQGTIHADTQGGTLIVDPNAVLGFVNDGILRASGGGTLDLSGSGGGQFTFGKSSVVEALDGGTITHRSSAFLTNLRDGTLTDGTYRVIDEGNGASLALAGGSITTNAASIELSGSGATFAQLSSLSENVGSLAVNKGAELNLSSGFTQAASGSLTVGINGASSDTSLWGRITSAGAAVLGGALDVAFNIGNTFTAAIGNTWKVLTAALRSGEFSTVNFTAEGLPANSKLAVNYLEDGVEVEVVPESAQLVTGVTYASWAAALPEGIDADPAADDDGDGASNLQEYAFAMDPSTSDAEFLPQPELVRMDGQTFAAIRYARLAGNAAPSDITYVVEQSADLENWVPADVESDSSLDELSEIETLKARCLNSLASSSGQCSYLRVSLERQ